MTVGGEGEEHLDDQAVDSGASRGWWAILEGSPDVDSLTTLGNCLMDSVFSSRASRNRHRNPSRIAYQKE